MIETYLDTYKNKYKNLELVIRPWCNHNCDYCYINKYGKELYPTQETNIDKILINIVEIINYVVITKQIPIENIYLFSGDLFTDNLLWLILEIFLKIKLSNCNIIIPLHPSFISEPNFEKQFEKYYNLLKQVNINLAISISADGRKIDRNKSYNYNDVIDFAEKYNFVFHPMISASNVNKWQKNYDWWMRHVDRQPAIMEVRNDDWTQDKIDAYLKVLDHIFDKRIEVCDNDINKFAYHYFIGDGVNNTPLGLPYYDIIKPIFTNRKGMLCTLQDTLSFDVSNKNLIPCHRISYEQFRAAKLEDNILVSENDTTFVTLHNLTRKGQPKCVNCIIRDYCMGSCFGAQFEAHGDLFTPNDSVCSLFQQKLIFIINKLYTTQTLQTGIQNGWASQSFLNSLNKLQKEVDKQYV